MVAIRPMMGDILGGHPESPRGIPSFISCLESRTCVYCISYSRGRFLEIFGYIFSPLATKPMQKTSLLSSGEKAIHLEPIPSYLYPGKCRTNKISYALFRLEGG